jgi:hypothetical protein
VATLLDTSALVVFLRSSRPTPGHAQLARVLGEELRAGQGLTSAAAAVELLVRATGVKGRSRLGGLLRKLPVVEHEPAVSPRDAWRSLLTHPASVS